MKKISQEFGALIVILIVAVLTIGDISYSYAANAKKAIRKPTQSVKKASKRSKPNKPLGVMKKNIENPMSKPVVSPKPIMPEAQSSVPPAAQATTPPPTPAAQATTPPPTPAAPVSIYGKNSIGYIGCSVAQLGVQGYAQSAGNSERFWPVYNTSGQSIDKWANADNPIWASFDAQIKNYGQPKAVWILPCKLTPTTNEVARAIQNIKQHAPSAKMYMSPFSDILPSDACPFANREHSDVDAALAGGPALTGPKLPTLAMSELDPAIFYCDPNSAGSAKIGKILADFFDKL